MVQQALQLKELADGEDHITLITFDMALYKKVIQLVEARFERQSDAKTGRATRSRVHWEPWDHQLKTLE